MNRFLIALTCLFGLTFGAAASPEPWYRGGQIGHIEAEMKATFAPGSCLAGTFMSASTSALAIPNVRVKPDAEFWFHHVQFPGARSPWDINPDGTAYLLRNFKPALRRAVLARLPENTTFVTYTGADLIAAYGFRPC